MKDSRPAHRLLVLTLFAAALLCVQNSGIHAADQVRFSIKLDPSLGNSNEPLSGRLLVFMTRGEVKGEMIEPDFTDAEAVYIAGMEVSNFDARNPIEMNADETAFPRAFSKTPPGEYQVMALLDRDHSYTFSQAGPGDIYSVIKKVRMPDNKTELTLSKMVPPRPVLNHPNAKLIDFESRMLSAFWGRPIQMQALVALPPGYESSGNKLYPTVYIIHGYGGTYITSDAAGVDRFLKRMTDGETPEMIFVFLNAHTWMGHHAFADSVNNGPWGSALVKEFIPYLEKQFRMDAKPSGRFLTGHSSGGWTTMWVMVTHPDFFGGTWSTSPDPVDFRNFTGPDITKTTPQNVYTDASGKEYNLVRDQGKELMTLRQYAQQERVLGYYGGQFGSFNAVFSPKGDDGQPMKLFDVDTGRIDPFVQKEWQKYNISRLLIDNWKTLGPKLKGKIHIVVGSADTFHLDESVRLLDAELKKLGSDAKIEYIEGRTHFNLYDGGLADRIAKEMYAVARPAVKSKGAK